MAFYNATDGPNWFKNRNWLSDKPLEEWHGVTVHNGRVTGLFLQRNQLTGPIPSELGNLVNLQQLDLSLNRLTGPLPPELGKLANLQELILGFNRLTGVVPPELSRLGNLRRLDLTENRLTGPIPPELGNLANLQELSLAQNKLTGPVLKELGSLANLRKLALSNNSLTGLVPSELGDLTNLRELSLVNNRLTGSIPPELGNLANLERLAFMSNRLTGPIPSELGNLTRLRALFLVGNRLTGPIPPELGNLINLELLWLNHNQLTGFIPRELGNLANLKELLLSHNRLRGIIPPSFTNLAALKKFWFDANSGLCAQEDRIIRTWLSGIGDVHGPDCPSSETMPPETMPPETRSPIFVPVLLTSAGRNNSFFTSELILTNRGATAATLHYTYTAHAGGGRGTAADSLAPRRQRIQADAIGYLTGLGIPISGSGNRIGTLRVDVSGSSEVSVMARTTTEVPEGRAGLAYPGIAYDEGFQEAVYLCGLRQNARDRSNVALQNMGAPGVGAITLRTTVFSGEADDARSLTLGEVTLQPGGFHQYSELLSRLGSPAQGYVKVEKVEGVAPFYAFGVINDNSNSDGSFVVPVTASSLVGTSGQTLPAIIETGNFQSELTVTNFSASEKIIDFSFVADAIHTAGDIATFSLKLEAGQQAILPDIVEELRRNRVAGIGPAGRAFVGALFAAPAEGDMSGIVIGARTGSPDGRGGQYSLFYNGVPYGAASIERTWIYGLQQNDENRSNLALVNTGEVDSSDSVFNLQIYDGVTGRLANTIGGIRVPALGWYQLDSILGDYAPETTQGYVGIRKVSGANPFLAYGVVNDGGAPGERSGDGAYLPGSE